MSVGMDLRLKRIFGKDGKTFILPFDHGISSGIIQGLDNIFRITDLANMYADAIMVRPGLMRQINKTLHKDMGVILCLTGRLYRGLDHVKLNSVEEAIRDGADAICVEYKVGSANDLYNLSLASELIEDAHKYNIPALVTSYPQKDFLEHAGERAYVDICRIAEEIGADFIKTDIPHNSHIIAECKNATSIPIVVAGGEKQITSVIEKANYFIKSGIDGVAIGRNVWGADDPYGIAEKIRDIVHGEMI